MKTKEIIKSKLLFAVQKIENKDGNFIVEDTGLYLKALSNDPGSFIKIYASFNQNKSIV